MIKVAEISKNLDEVGYLDLSKLGTSISIDNKVYPYLASGLAKQVYISPCGNWVLKLPKDLGSSFHLQHLAHEAAVYAEAPDWCKNNIAKTIQLPNGWILQERLKIVEGGMYFRELGVRSDGTYVIFDCDPFLTFEMGKPKEGYDYIKPFSVGRFFGSAHEEAVAIPKRHQREVRLAVEKRWGDLNDCVVGRGEDGVYRVNGEPLTEDEVTYFRLGNCRWNPNLPNRGRKKRTRTRK